MSRSVFPSNIDLSFANTAEAAQIYNPELLELLKLVVEKPYLTRSETKFEMDDLGEYGEVTRSVRRYPSKETDHAEFKCANVEKALRIGDFLDIQPKEFFDTINNLFFFVTLNDETCPFEDREYALVTPGAEGAVGKTVLDVYAHFVAGPYQHHSVCQTLQNYDAKLTVELGETHQPTSIPSASPNVGGPQPNF